MKRILLCTLLALMLLCAACTEGAADPPDPASATPYEPPKIETQTVTLATVGTGMAFQAWEEKVETDVNRILEEENAPLRLDLLCLENASPALLQAEMENLDVDLLLHGYGAITQELVDRGMVADISDALRERPDLLAITPDRAWKETLIDGKMFCFPLIQNYEGIMPVKYQVMFENKYMEEMGVDRPTSPEELLAALETAHLKNAEDAGLARYKLIVAMEEPPHPLHRTYDEWPFVVDADSRFVLYGDGTIGPYIGSDIFLQDAAFYRQLYENDLLLLEKREDFDAGSYSAALFSIPPKFLPPPEEDITYREDGSVTVESSSVSTGPLDYAPEKPYFREGSCAENALYVANQCDDVEAAMTMLEYLYLHREVTDALFYGIEGVDWTLNDDGTMTQQIGSDLSWRFVHQFQAREYGPKRSDSGGGEGTAPVSIEFAGSGFLFDESMKANSAWRDIDFSDVYLLRAGFLPLSEMQTVLDQLNAQGYQEMLEECRQQYAAYVERCQ